MTATKPQIVYLSYGDILTDNGYKTRLFGQLNMLDTDDWEKYLISFEKKISYRQNFSRINRIKYQLAKQKIDATILPRQNNFSYDFHLDIWSLYSLLRKLKFSHGIIHAHSLYACYMANAIKKYFNARVIFDMHGLALPELEIQRANMIKKLVVRHIEAECLKNSDCIITASDSLKKYLQNNYQLCSTIFTLPCLVDHKLFPLQSPAKTNKIKKQLGLPEDQPITVYLGGMQSWQNPEKIIRFVKRHQLFLLFITKDIKLAEKSLQQLPDRQHKIISADHDQVHQYLQLADFGLLFRNNILLNQISFPTKFAEYLICGLPVFHNGAITDINNITANQRLGLNIENNNVKQYIRHYQKNQSDHKKYCRSYAIEKLSLKKFRNHLNNICRKILQPKILYLATTGHYGGVQKYIYELAHHFKENCQVTVATGKDDSSDNFFSSLLLADNINYYQLGQLTRHISPIKNILSIFEIYSLIKQQKSDIVHTNSSMAGFVGRLAACFNQVPLVLYTAHGWVFAEDINLFSKNLYIIIEQLAANWCHQIICLTRPDLKLAKKLHIVSGKELVYLPNGINIPRINHLANTFDSSNQKYLNLIKQWKSSGCKIIGCIANLYPAKNLATFLKIAAELKSKKTYPLKYFIIGSGQLKNSLEAQIKKNNLEDIVFLTDFLANPYPLLVNFDLYLSTSSKEGLPFSIMEAAALKIPIISSRVGGIPDIISSNLVDDPYDINIYCRKIIQILDANSNNNHQITANFQNIKTKFNDKEIFLRYAKIYHMKQ